MRKTTALLAAALWACAGPRLAAQSSDASGLQGESLNNPTSLQFGPDDRLYVSQQDGKIFAYAVEADGSGYRVTATEEIALLQSVLNHSDVDGSIYAGLVKRQITGILVAGSAAEVVLYVTSSDYRIGGGGGGADLDLDTNSGIVHELRRQPDGSWARVDLVRGLPRSEENHASNGMQLSPDGQTLYLAQGGHTNAGAPSNNFAFVTEYALAAAVLTIDLAAIEAMPTLTWHEDGSLYKYDLPTVDDPTRPNTGPGGADVGDPFGGNDGLNQAKVVEGGPVQVYATGFRNLYDLVLAEDGRLYGWDNGANGGWGGHPADEGYGTATNEWIAGEPGSSGPGPNDDKVNNKDGLHFITGPGYYAGHPNPIRANPSGAGLFTQSGGGGGAAGVWRTSTTGPDPLPADWPPVPPHMANPVEGDFRNAGVDDGSLWTITSSTNGMCEYTSTANGGALRGDLLAASFNGKIYRVERNAAGAIDADDDVTILAENFGATPLDVTARPDGVPFAGTIWAATYGANNITVFTPTDTSTTGGGTVGTCEADSLYTLDDDGDGYSNADEYDNGTDPCSQASTPPDHDGTLIDGFKVSDRNDPDDDDDGLPDDADAFALDPDDGLATALPLDLPLLNGDPGTGFFGLGFTGLMANGDDYLDLVADETNSATEIIAGGAVGLFTINGAGAGDAYLGFNTLENGFQVGFPITADSAATTLEAKLLGPIWTGEPTNFQQAGIALSDGTQHSYLKIAPISVNGPAVQIQYQEDDGHVLEQNHVVDGLAEASEIRLQLEIDPAAGTVQPLVALGVDTLCPLGAPVALRGDLLAAVQGPAAAALSLFVTSGRSGVTMDATYDYLRITGPGAPDTVVSPPDTVVSPPDTTGGIDSTCTAAAYSTTLDDDGDGYSNADEYDNGTDPCSQASTPPDHDGTLIDGFKVSDRNDPDDDDDGLPDDADAFALDPDDGLATALPLDLPLLNGDPGTGFFGLGFTGLMANGDDYLDLVADETNSATEIIAGGAVGLFTINGAGAGDAYLGFNTLENGFQVGFPITADSAATTLEAKLLGPIWTGEPTNYQQAGIALSDGTQDNYLKVVAINLTTPQIQIQYQESDAAVEEQNVVVDGLAAASEVSLFLEIDPSAGTVQASVDLGDGRRALGTPIALTGALLDRVTGAEALAVGLITTSAAPGVTMNATWDYVRVTQNAAPPTGAGSWTTIDGDGACADLGDAGSCAQGRHEGSYVQVGRRFYLLGGRENGSNVNVYDPATDTWTAGAQPGFPVHHFQAVAFDGLVYAIGVLADNNFPNEQPYDKVLIYDPARDRWFDGPDIPAGRVRGAAGCVASGGKLYLVGGLTVGHASGWSDKFDEYDPATGEWRSLPALPRARDHFHAALAGGRLYVAGGRRTGQETTFLPTIGAVDVFDFATETWSTLPTDLPTQRAAATAAVVNGELLVIGGERDPGAANDDVEALDLTTNRWRALAPLNEGRHGTQAIVNNGAVYVASGSPVQGAAARARKRSSPSGRTSLRSPGRPSNRRA